MTELHNIWLRTEGRELIRADRVISLLFDEQGVRSGGVRARVAGGFRQDTMRTVNLVECAEECGARAVAELAAALARAAGHSAPAVFVHSGEAQDGHPQWEVSAAPPPG
jgi:hypothetical protein